MYIVGVDLSGPTNTSETAIAVFSADTGSLTFSESQCDGSDPSLLATIDELSRTSPVVVGLDAPLSYQPGGGQRDRDAELRQRIVARGMHPGSVMAPTMNRMAYLTLRGVVLAHLLSTLAGTHHPVRVVEVHPGAALCLRDAPVNLIGAFGKDETARGALLAWLQGQFVQGVQAPSPCSSHFVAACAAAVAAWDWHLGKSRWLALAQPPWHPYDFAS